MDNLLGNGDVLWDCAGDFQAVRGYRELIQRAMIRLKMKKGSFAFLPELGSRLHQLDAHHVERSTLLAAVQEALDGLDGIAVTDVEASLDVREEVLYLTVYLQVLGESAILELQRELQG